MTQAVSLVVQREKEKAEIKDKKVLEILQIKDDRISELEKLLSQQQAELNDFVARKIALDGEKDLLEKTNRELQSKVRSLEELVQSRESRLKTNEELNRQVIDNLDRDKQGLTKRVTEHLIEADKAKEELAKFRLTNDKLDNRVKLLEDDLHDVRQRYNELSKEHEDTLNQVGKQEQEISKQETEVDMKERENKKLRKELSELRSVHSQCSGHAAQQGELIKQLQSLQFDTQQVMKNQEEAHTMEASSLQAMYADLNSRYQTIKQALERAERELASVPEKTIGLQVNLSPWDAEIQTCENCIVNECKMSSLQTEIDLLKERLKEKSRLIYSLDKENSEKRDVFSAVSKQIYTEGMSSPHTSQKCSVRSRSVSPIRSPLHASSPKIKTRKSLGLSTNKKTQNLEQALELKNEECEEIQAAHNRRLHRLRTLQQNYNILKEQIKTYEEGQSGKKKRKKMHRSDPRSLQQEDSDTVWNELTYFKGQNRNLLMDRMNLQEELDLLKVQTASDATHVEQLTHCLHQEKEQLRVQLAEAERNRKVKDAERKEMTELKKQIKSCENLLESLEKENATLMDERDNLIKEKRALKTNVGMLKTDLGEKDAELHHFKKENRYMKKKLRHRKHGQSRRRHKSVKDHQRALNKSIEQMSAIFSDFQDDGWEEISSESGAETGESLGCQIVESARKYKPHGKSKIKRHKARDESTPTKTKPTSRQMASVQSHIKRLARAYDEEPVEKCGHNNIAIQTDDEIAVTRTPRRFIDMGVGEYSVDEGSESDSTLIRSTVKQRDMATSPHIGLHKLGKSLSKVHSRAESPNISSLKQRLASLQQQVSVLRDSKASIQKTLNDERESKEQIQSDFNLCNQRLKITKQTVQKLTQELENCQTMKESLERQLETKIEALEGSEVVYGKLPSASSATTNKHTDTEWKQIESRLKSSTSEVTRQAGVIKTLKSENESQVEQLKSLQDKMNRLERDISQKRSLIEDLRAKVKSTQEEKKSDTDTIKSLEEKIKSVTEGSDQKKSYTESLKKRVSALTKEKHQYEELYMKTNAELEKKTRQLIESQTKRTEAENTATELETAAAQQLYGLASRSESALEAVKAKLKKAHLRIQELNQFVKILAAELLNQVQDARELVRQAKKSKTENGSKKGQSMSKVHSLASSILNMSEADVEEFMNSTEATLEEEMATEKLEEHRQDTQWNKRWQAAVNSKVPFARN
ncbi:centlein-like isoform X2 [Ptychodera flava]